MLELNFKPFPILETERLILRKITDDDAASFFEMRSNPEVMKFIPRPLANSVDDCLELITIMNDKIENNIDINWTIRLKTSDTMIGHIGFFRTQPENYRTEVGYILHPNFHGLGFATEALQAALKYGFESLQFNSIEAIIDPRNTASEKVLLNNNFVKEGHFLENGFFNGEFLDSAVYSILKRNFTIF